MEYFPVSVVQIQWLAPLVFEVEIERPEGFDFIAGQNIRFSHNAVVRDYSLVNAPQDSHLTICGRLIPHGEFTPHLARSKAGQVFQISSAFGYFTFQPSRRQPVFIATGTGIAPFVAYVRAGVKQFHLLHGVRSTEELYYSEIVSVSAKTYTPCISQGPVENASLEQFFAGRVTDYLRRRLPAGDYDFYLSGRGEMVREAMEIIDERFDGARVYTEPFF